MPRGCSRCHTSYPRTKLLPDGLQESSAWAGGRAQPTKTLHLCSAGPAMPGPPARHLGGKMHAGASGADRESTQKRAKPCVQHTSCVPFSAPGTSGARDESKLSRRLHLSRGSASVLLVMVRSAPAQRRSPHPTACAGFTHSCRGGGVTATFTWDRRVTRGDFWREPKPAQAQAQDVP